jgi:hypothetical protein
LLWKWKIKADCEKGIDSPGIVFYTMNKYNAEKKTFVTEAERERSKERSVEI